MRRPSIGRRSPTRSGVAAEAPSNERGRRSRAPDHRNAIMICYPTCYPYPFQSPPTLSELPETIVLQPEFLRGRGGRMVIERSGWTRRAWAPRRCWRWRLRHFRHEAMVQLVNPLRHPRKRIPRATRHPTQRSRQATDRIRKDGRAVARAPTAASRPAPCGRRGGPTRRGGRVERPGALRRAAPIPHSKRVSIPRASRRERASPPPKAERSNVPRPGDR